VRKHLCWGFRSLKIVTAMAADKKSFLSIDSITARSFIDCSADSAATRECFNC
jgi:hypothetical protein